MTVPASLERTVDAFWRFTSFGRPARVLPDGCMDFVFDLNTAKARLVGSMTRAEIVAPPRGTHYFGVRFLPGAAALLIDARACELTDFSEELSVLLPARGRHLAEQVAEAKSDSERVQVIARYLATGSTRVRAEDPRLRVATLELARTFGALRVRELALTTGVSERQLERLFQERVGVRPEIEACLPSWEALGYSLTVRVPESGEMGFAILQGPAPGAAELMLQTRDSLRDDLPSVAQKKPSFLLYANVDSLADARRALLGAEVLVEERTTFYGATESWLQVPGGAIVGLAKHG